MNVFRPKRTVHTVARGVAVQSNQEYDWIMFFAIEYYVGYADSTSEVP